MDHLKPVITFITTQYEMIIRGIDGLLLVFCGWSLFKIRILEDPKHKGLILAYFIILFLIPAILIESYQQGHSGTVQFLNKSLGFILFPASLVFLGLLAAVMYFQTLVLKDSQNKIVRTMTNTSIYYIFVFIVHISMISFLVARHHGYFSAFK